jgi:hypothetical protein
MKQQWKHKKYDKEKGMGLCIFSRDQLRHYGNKQYICHCGALIEKEDMELFGTEPEENPFTDDIYPVGLLQ